MGRGPDLESESPGRTTVADMGEAVLPFAPRRPVKSAIAWTAIAELVRRHHPSHDMRAYVTRPCSGMYFCLQLFRGKLQESALRFNLEGTSFDVHPAFGAPRLERPPWPERGFYEF